MKTFKKAYVVICVSFLILLPSLSAAPGSSNLDKIISNIANGLFNAVSGTKIKRIGISEFNPTAGTKVKLGPYLSDRLMAILPAEGKIELIERARLDVLLQEIALNQTGLVDEKSAQEVGKVLGVQAFVIGSYTVFPKKTQITARLVETETGKVLTAVSETVKIDSDLKALLEPLVPDVPLVLEATLLAQRKTDRGWEAVMVEEGGTLYSNDNVKLHFRTNEDCYVYALMFDSTGKASQIFPHPDISMSNRIEGKKDYRIPPGNDWYWLDNNIGTETIYVIASYEQMDDITKLLMEMEQAGADAQAEISKKIEHGIGSRGFAGVRQGEIIIDTTSDGKKIEKVTQLVEGKVTAVRRISFEHK